MKRPFITAIMAAGKGTRMESDLPKVLHPVHGKPMLLHVIDRVRDLGSRRIISIIGHRRDLVADVLKPTGTEWVVQEPQLGTGHAVAQVEPLIRNFSGDLLVLSGDVPMLRSDTIQKLLETHWLSGAGATVLTAIFTDPTGYGRIIRNTDGRLDRIVEHKDCTDAELAVNEINSGIYVFNAKLCFRALKMIDNNNKQGEYYLPDALRFIAEFGQSIALQIVPDPFEISGVNTQKQLSEINRIFLSCYET